MSRTAALKAAPAPAPDNLEALRKLELLFEDLSKKSSSRVAHTALHYLGFMVKGAFGPGVMIQITFPTRTNREVSELSAAEYFIDAFIANIELLSQGKNPGLALAM